MNNKQNAAPVSDVTPCSASSLTPETDKKATDIIGFFSCETVPASFARKLEIERNIANGLNRDRDEWKARYSDIVDRLEDKLRCTDECKCSGRREVNELRAVLQSPKNTQISDRPL